MKPDKVRHSCPARLATLRGFTLVELVVTIAIAGILAAIAVPAMQNLLAGRAVDGQAQELAASLRLARSEALKRGMKVSVCASDQVEAATPTCSGTEWAAGWLVFADEDDGGTLNGNEKPVRVQASAKGLRTVTASASSLTFAQSGVRTRPDSDAFSFVLKPNISSSSGSYAAAVRTVCVNRQGRVSVNRGEVQCP